MDVQVDVLIVGGGIQGLMTLRRCLDAGWRNVALVTRDEIGHGETLHSHGYDLGGYVLPPGADAFLDAFTESASFWREWTAAHGVACDHSHPTFVGGTDEAMAGRARMWDAQGMPYDERPELPAALTDGVYSREGHTVFGTQNRRLQPWRIVEALVPDLQDHLVRGALTEVRLDETGNRVDHVVVAVDGGSRVFRPRQLVLAAGRDNQAIMRSILDAEDREPFRDKLAGFHRVRDIPMILMRGPLPEFSGFFTDLPMCLICHTDGEAQPVWVLTALDRHTVTNDDVDTNEEPPVNAALVEASLTKLYDLVPAIATEPGRYEYSVYFGKKIDHPDDEPTWYLGDLGLENLLYAWPVYWTMSAVASQAVADALASVPDAARFSASEPFAGAAWGVPTGVPVGEERRRSDIQEWLGWDEFRARYLPDAAAR